MLETLLWYRSSSQRRKNRNLRVVGTEQKRKIRVAEIEPFGFALAQAGRKAIPWLFTSFAGAYASALAVDPKTRTAYFMDILSDTLDNVNRGCVYRQ